MFIVMHCGGLPFNGNTIKEQSLGGSETAAYYMARELAALGHKVTIFTNSKDAGIFDDVKYEWAGHITEAAPLGENFTHYAENTPHDVSIIQRHLRAYERKWASKINLWWLHDLALGRNKRYATEHLWNVDKILCVSKWHKKQIMKSWGVEDSTILVVRNGIDLDLFEGAIDAHNMPSDKYFNMLYCSRPERGLLHLIKEGGIMERLADKMPDARLYVCGYANNVPQLAELYAYIEHRIKTLPNVFNLGALTKKQLADTMRSCQLLTYPTNFDEVSCITAMEAMAAGLPFMATDRAALPETCEDGGAIFVYPEKEQSLENAFVAAIIHARESGILNNLGLKQLDAARWCSWKMRAQVLEHEIYSMFARLGAYEQALTFHYLRHSDIAAIGKSCDPDMHCGPLSSAMRIELERGYEFYRTGKFKEHYEAYYAYEKERGVNYGPEDCTNTARYQWIANLVGSLPAGSRVLDYGCAHGHYTVNLAKRFPDKRFVGADLVQSNIETAQKWAADEGLQNATFEKVDSVADADRVCNEADFDMIIAAEVLEHVADPQNYVDALATYLTDSGQMVITTPFGPWEAQGYRQHNYWRAHLHHFERADLHDMFGHHPGFKIVVAPSGMSQFQSVLGSYITMFGKPTEPSGDIDYKRKRCLTVPDQTISLCMIVKNGAADLRKCLDRALPFVQEVIIGVDPTTTDATYAVLNEIREQNPLVAFHTFQLERPVLETGFAAARNATIDHATCDWILWLDADELLSNGQYLCRYTRNNQYTGYAIRQHHFSEIPLGVARTDLPCRLFRNRKGVKFFGVVHEHPEIELNDGLGAVALLPHVEIMHYGYSNETVRRMRFQRNISLLERDRKENPERTLGKFLMLRDLAQACQYDVKDGRANLPIFELRVAEGLRLWDDLMKSGNVRLITDAVPFYSMLVGLKGDGFDFGISLDASKLNGGAHPEKAEPIVGRFLNMEHVNALMNLLIKDKTAGFEAEYF